MRVLAEAGHLVVGISTEVAEEELLIPRRLLRGTGELWHTPSVDNPNFASEQSLQSHVDKHVTQQWEFGNITEEQYISDAKKLVTSKPGGDILTYTRSNGDTLFYNKANNEFAVVTNKGVIRTFFKPANGI